MSLEVRRDAEREGLTLGYTGGTYCRGLSSSCLRLSLKEGGA